MAIDFKTFNEIVDFVLDDLKPVMIRGRHGVGKSQVVYQTAQRRQLKVVERRASQMTEGDLIGLPQVEGGATKWLAPDWFKECCENPRLLFLDEVDRAIPEVRQGIMELTDSRKLNGNHLHPQTLVMAAVNGGEHGASYSVGELDPAELDRWVVWDINPTVEDWLTWAKDNVHPTVVDFINQNRNHLEHLEDVEPNKVYPSRRSWHRLNDCLVKGGLLNDKERLGTVFHLACGFVGLEGAVAFKDFVQNYETELTPKMVLEGQVERVKEMSCHKTLGLCDKVVDFLEGKTLTNEEVENLAKFCGVLPAEQMMKLWSDLASKNSACLDALHRTTVNGVPFGLYLAGLVA